MKPSDYMRIPYDDGPRLVPVEDAKTRDLLVAIGCILFGGGGLAFIVYCWLLVPELG